MTEYSHTPEAPDSPDFLYNFAVSRAGLDLRQQAIIRRLLENRPEFRQRLLEIYQVSQRPGEENARRAVVLLERIKSDIQAILEIEG